MWILLFFGAIDIFLQYVSTVPTAPVDKAINSCTGGEFEIGSSVSILCKFNYDVNISRLAFFVSHSPSLQTNGKGVLQCNWHTNGTLHCTKIEGYSYQNENVNDQLKLDIPKFSPAFAGFYTCYVFDDGQSSTQPCAVVVKDAWKDEEATRGLKIAVPCLVIIILILVVLFIAGYMKGNIILCFNTRTFSSVTSHLLARPQRRWIPSTSHEEEEYEYADAVTKSVQTNTDEDFGRTSFNSYFNMNHPLGPEMRSYPIYFNLRQRV